MTGINLHIIYNELQYTTITATSGLLAHFSLVPFIQLFFANLTFAIFLLFCTFGIIQLCNIDCMTLLFELQLQFFHARTMCISICLLCLPAFIHFVCLCSKSESECFSELPNCSYSVWMSSQHQDIALVVASS